MKNLCMLIVANLLIHFASAPSLPHSIALSMVVTGMVLGAIVMYRCIRILARV